MERADPWLKNLNQASGTCRKTMKTASLQKSTFFTWKAQRLFWMRF